MSDHTDINLDEGFELNDDMLDAIAGGYIYHDEGDAAAHRSESYYVLDSTGRIVMRLDSMPKAEHWAENLRTSTRVLNADEFEKIRRTSL